MVARRWRKADRQDAPDGPAQRDVPSSAAASRPGPSCANLARAPTDLNILFLLQSVLSTRAQCRANAAAFSAHHDRHRAH